MEATIKVNYGTLNRYEFSQLILKIVNTPTQPEKAAQIRKLVNAVQKLNEKIKAEYKSTIMEQFYKKDDKGEFAIEEKDGQKVYVVLEGKEEEAEKAEDAFYKKEATLSLAEVRQFSPHTLSDIKMSAKEIEILGNLFTEQNGPGVPSLF